MKIVIAKTDIATIDPMLNGWQKGDQSGFDSNPKDGEAKKLEAEKLKELWRENAQGIRTSAQDQTLVQVYNEMTGIVYLLACLRNWRGALTVSEVVSNPQVSQEKASANDVGKIYLHWVSRNSPNTDKQGLGCLFSWADGCSTKPLQLTANTMGLIKLYANYGFEIVPPAKPGVPDYLANPTSEKKYTKIDQNMKLSQTGKTTLQTTYAVGRDWVVSGAIF